MDIYGMNPSGKAGEYFRANVWSWSPILERIAATGVLPSDLVEEMGYNSGAGPDAVLAGVLADALEAMVRDTDDDGIIVALNEDGKNGTAMVGLEALRFLTGSTESADFSTSVAHLREFIEFARASGGFEVW
jgi:hypothetical protein